MRRLRGIPMRTCKNRKISNSPPEAMNCVVREFNVFRSTVKRWRMVVALDNYMLVKQERRSPQATSSWCHGKGAMHTTLIRDGRYFGGRDAQGLTGWARHNDCTTYSFSA